MIVVDVWLDHRTHTILTKLSSQRFMSLAGFVSSVSSVSSVGSASSRGPLRA